jgi:hypothetical protein
LYKGSFDIWATKLFALFCAATLTLMLEEDAVGATSMAG